MKNDFCSVFIGENSTGHVNQSILENEICRNFVISHEWETNNESFDTCTDTVPTF